MSKYKATIGLEIHAELLTKTKMFCHSKNDTQEKRPNVNICPVCMGHPGTLPVINKEAVRQVLRIGVAAGGKLADYTEFDRKNYFYPDIPKGYQLSQYKFPLVSGGNIAGVKLTRIHLEEDTAKSTHDKGEVSLVDFNRAGVPLMELVTEPVIHDAETAAKFAKELQLLLWYLDASGANMERGEMRVEANISVSSGKELGTKVEVKNLNSFRAVEKAILYETERQSALLEEGSKVVQETRGWDENKEETFSQRAKEESHDYRYFPDPDLPKLYISEIPEFSEDTLRDSLPELPWQTRERLLTLGITPEHADIYITQREWGDFFDKVIGILKNKEDRVLASNYITSELKEPIDAEKFCEVIRMLASQELSSKGAKEVLRLGGGRKVAEENGLIQESREEVLRPLVEEVISKGDKSAPVEFFIGQAMKISKNANPAVVRKLLLEVLNH
jgi:aspartyl-tRNA(Asn)/glutamyl-tRNA(Gln) amidotransferase subunit B